MNGTTDISTCKPTDADAAPAFDGFPYLVTRVVPSLHHVLLLPRRWDIEHLVRFAQRQVTANRFLTCLVLAEDLCIYFNEDGSGRRSSEIPRGVRIVSEKLQPAEPVPESPELSVRRMELVLLEEAQDRGPGTTIIMGHLTKGGRLPTPEEEERLKGTQAGNVPRGLLPCLQCGEWRGECFDTLCRDLVVRVHCRCENDNRCAACGGLLYERKLNANYFEPGDGTIWHTPGFSAFHHLCVSEKGV